jgi:5-methylcytosine-specific restriction endonuclease McrBC regulatory subunit McrC
MELNLVEEETFYMPEGVLSPRCLKTIETAYAEYFSLWWVRKHGSLMAALRSKGYVGVFPLGRDGSIRVEPKISCPSIWKMITNSLGEQFDYHPPENVRSVADLLHHLVVTYVRLVEGRLARGLLWDYKSNEEGGQPIRGRIIGPDVRRPPLVQCRYEKGGYDHRANQRILWTLSHLEVAVSEKVLVRRISRLKKELAPQICLKPIAGGGSPVRYPRLFSDYHTLDVLSALLLNHLSPGVLQGGFSTVPFVLHMPTLFEEGVAGWVYKTFGERVLVRRQWSVPLKGKNSPCFRIDIALIDKETLQAFAVFDTKYKRDTRPTTTDIQQVTSYAVETGAKNAVLLYPQKNIERAHLSVGPIAVRSVGFDFASEDWDEVVAEVSIYVNELIEAYK